MRLSSGLALAALLTLSFPVSAQLTQGAPGRVWVKSVLFVQETDERYDVIGVRRPFLNANGVSDAKALFTEVVVGLHSKLDFWVQAPYFDLTFTDDVQSLRKTGFGDIRAWLRWNITRLFGGRTPISIRAGAKAPIGESPIDAQLIPLGEGQWDIEAYGEVGHSFWPAPAYAILWLGYRVRLENSERFIDPGNEFVFLGEAGLNPTPDTFLKATFDGFRGERRRVDGVLTASQRRIATLQFTVRCRQDRFGPKWGFGSRSRDRSFRPVCSLFSERARK